MAARCADKRGPCPNIAQCKQIRVAEYVSAPHETDDVLDRLHGFGGERLRARRAVGQHRVDIDRSRAEPRISAVIGAELGDQQIGQRGLKVENWRAAELR